MERRQLGKTGMEVSILGFGGAEIGYQAADPVEVRRLLDDALDDGLNVIDTAECYKTSEEMIGKAVSGRRSDFFLFTKTGHIEDGDHWSPAKMKQQIGRSLQRLKTPYVDLLQLHSCSEAQLRDGAVIEVVQRARDAGQTRYIGYSGDGKAALYAIQSGAFDTLQTSVNIADQEAIDLTLPLAAEKRMGVIVKRPLANAAWKTGAKPTDAYHHTYWERLQELQYDFLKEGVNPAVSTALRFTLACPAVTLAIVGTRTPDRWRENKAMLDAGPIDVAQFEKIRARWRAVAQPDWIGQT